MDLGTAWQLFTSTPAGYIILAFIGALLYLLYYAAKRYFDEREQDRAQRATEIERETKDDERGAHALEGMLTALTTTVTNQTEITKAVKEQADATRMLSEMTTALQQTLVSSLEGLAAAMGKAMYEHEQTAKGRQQGILDRIDTLETTVRQLITDLAEARAQSDQEREHCFEEIGADIKAALAELRDLRKEIVALPTDNEPEASDDSSKETPA